MKRITLLMVITLLVFSACKASDEQDQIDEQTEIATENLTPDTSDSEKDNLEVPAENDVNDQDIETIDETTEPSEIVEPGLDETTEDSTPSDTESTEILETANEEPIIEVVQETDPYDYYPWIIDFEVLYGYLLEETIDDTDLVSQYAVDLLNLDPSDVTSISTSLDIYKTYASDDQIINDGLYKVFYNYLNSIFKSHYWNFSTSDVSHQVYLDNGFVFLCLEGDDYLEVDSTYLYNNFEPFLSVGQNDYNAIISFEQEQVPGSSFIMDASIQISWDDFSDRITSREAYCTTYKDSIYDENIDDFLKTRDTLFRIYIGELRIDNSPIFNFSDSKIDPELYLSYERFLENHPDSVYYDSIQRFLVLLEEQDYQYNEPAMEAFYDSVFDE